MSTLRIMTCGSVDDGKSTLIGRLLYDTNVLYKDQIKFLEEESHHQERLDYAALLDGLSAEREQGITIDVAFRYFASPRRSFIVADTPGHAEYTRNMAVGASVSDLAILLIDMTKGVQIQTKRHLRICHMMGIHSYVFALNKMDLVDYNQKLVEGVQQELTHLLNDLGIEGGYTFIPISAREGENLLLPSDKMPWYQGKALLTYLEEVNVHDAGDTSFVLPVQRISRFKTGIRGIQGEVARGHLKLGDEVEILPSRTRASVNKLYYLNQEVEMIKEGQPVTLVLNEDLDVSRGNVLTQKADLEVGKDFEARLLWLDDLPLEAGRHFIMKLGTKQVTVMVTKIQGEVEIETGMSRSTNRLEKNSLSICYLSSFEAITFSQFESLAHLGRFILIDKLTKQTVACGTIQQSLAQAQNLSYQKAMITRKERSHQKMQEAYTIWFTGLSGSGKSTLANRLEQKLMQFGKHTMLLDGDTVRLGLNKNLGFSSEERSENIRRISEVAKLMNDAGLITIASTISPKESDREMAKHIIGEESFIEVYVSTSLRECERRDVKGLYKKARKGEIKQFTGIDAPYEVPRSPKIILDTEGKQIEESLNELVNQIAPLID